MSKYLFGAVFDDRTGKHTGYTYCVEEIPDSVKITDMNVLNELMHDKMLRQVVEHNKADGHDIFLAVVSFSKFDEE